MPKPDCYDYVRNYYGVPAVVGMRVRVYGKSGVPPLTRGERGADNMSHRDSCPDRYEARREGERAHDRGFGSFRNPYGGYGPERCEEAESAWRSGWYAAERAQEEREAEAAHERAARRRMDEEAEYYEQMEAGRYDEQS